MRLKYILNFPYKNKAEVVEFLIVAWAMSVKKDVPAKRNLGVLRDYILYGYNEETRKSILLNTGIRAENLHVINSNLEKSGYLDKNPNKLIDRVLSKDMQVIKDAIDGFAAGIENAAVMSFNRIKQNG